MTRRYIDALQEDPLGSRSCNCDQGLFSTFHYQCGCAADHCLDLQDDVQPYVTMFRPLSGLPTIRTIILEQYHLAVIIQCLNNQLAARAGRQENTQTLCSSTYQGDEEAYKEMIEFGLISECSIPYHARTIVQYLHMALPAHVRSRRMHAQRPAGTYLDPVIHLPRHQGLAVRTDVDSAVADPIV